MSVHLLYSATGFFVGLLVGQTGMGGGSLVTPILVLVFGVPPAAAVGTDLLYASITKAAGTVVHGANQHCAMADRGAPCPGQHPEHRAHAAGQIHISI